jgi:predicted peroxiredoxin
MPSSPAPLRPLMVKITCGAEAPERANQAWTVAATALAAGADVRVWLTGEAVWFAVRDAQPDLGLEHATPVADLAAPLLDLGAVVVCTQCAARRGLTQPDLLAGSTIAGAATFVERILQPDVQALVY